MADQVATRPIGSPKDEAFAYILALFGLVLAAFVVPGLRLGGYNFDSWAFYELSINFFEKFYRIWTFRSYFTDQPYSASYPPLYPLGIALADRMFGLRWLGGLAVNVAAVMALAACSGEIARRLCGSRSIGWLAALASLCFLPFSAEMAGARSHPLSLLLLSLTVLVLVQDGPIGVGSGFWLGVLSGLGILNRFDWQMPAALLGVLLLFWTRRPLVPLAYGAACLLTISPWIAYSFGRFGVIMASDSAWIATAARFGYWSTDYVQSPGPVRIDGAGALLAKLIAGRGTLADLAADFARHIGPLCAAVLLTLLIRRAQSGTWPRLIRTPLSPPMRRFAALLVVWSGVVFSVWLTGYASVRYVSGLVWHILLLGSCVLAVSLDQGRDGERRQIALVLASVLAVTGFGLSAHLNYQHAHGAPMTVIEQRDRTLATCLRAAGGTPERTVLFASDELFSVQFGPLERWAAAVPPRNLAALSAEDVASLIERFRVGFAVAEAPGSALSRFYEGAALPGCPQVTHRIAVETVDER